MRIAKLALTAGPLAALVFAAVPASAAASPHVYHIGHCTAVGQDADCMTGGGDVNRPASIWVQVKASPDQKLDVSWWMDCFKGDSFSSRDGDYTVTTPVKRRLLPQPGKREGSCSVTVDVSLDTYDASGSIGAWLTATKRPR